jgi:MscS family membrane protein
MNFDWLQSKQWWQTLRHNTWDSSIFHVFLVLLAAGVINLVAVRLLARVKSHITDKTENPWDDSLLAALPPPLRMFIWAIGLRVASLLIGGEIFVDPRATQLFVVVLIVTTAWFLVRWITGIENELVRLSVDQKKGDEERLDETTAHAIGKLLRLATMLTAALVALQYLNINISAVLTFGGIGGIAIGFAAKDLLANFFGGLTVYLDQPFKVGDWIRSPDRELEGTVEYIGWRHTRIRTFDKRPLYVPNAIFTTIVIENPQRMLNRRIYETIGIRYDDISKMDAITSDVKTMLKNHPEIDQSQLMMVYFNAFAASSCDFFVYTFTETTNWAYYHEVKHGVLLKIAAIIESHGAEMAFPTSTLHVANLPEPPVAG